MPYTTETVYEKIREMVQRKVTRSKEIGVDSLALALHMSTDELIPLLHRLQLQHKIIIRQPERRSTTHALSGTGTIRLKEDSE